MEGGGGRGRRGDSLLCKRKGEGRARGEVRKGPGQLVQAAGEWVRGREGRLETRLEEKGRGAGRIGGDKERLGEGGSEKVRLRKGLRVDLEEVRGG